MTNWWQSYHSNKDQIMTTASTPNGDVTAQYPQDLTTYSDCYGMSSPSYPTEYQHDPHYAEVATPPTSASQSQSLPFASNVPLSYAPNYMPPMPQSPQSVYSDTSYQTLDQQMMASPFLSPLPPQQIYYLQRGQSLKEASTRRLSANHGAKAPNEIRHSWPMLPMHLTFDSSSGMPVPAHQNIDNQTSVPMDLDPHSGSALYEPPMYQHHPQPHSPEMSQSSQTAQPFLATRSPRELSIPPSLRPGPKQPSQSQPQSRPPTESPNPQAQGAKHSCPIPTCHCTYKRKFELDRHLQEKHGPNSGRLLCPGDMCPRGIPGEGFDRMAHLVNHLISGKHNWTKEQAVYAARKFNPKKGGAGVRVSEARLEMMT